LSADSPPYTVHAIRTGTMTVDRAALLYGVRPGTLVDIPVWAALVEGHGRRILVDTGLANAARWQQYQPTLQKPGESLGAALAELGWSLGAIDAVVNSHLHYDHCENNPALTQAQFFVSAREWDYAQRPVPSQAWSYAAEWTGADVTIDDYTLITTDDYELMPGIRIIRTPGHTPGHQSVLVDTAEGVLCIAGDAACLMENLSLPTPTTVTISVEQSLASLARIRASADRVLMNHDPSVSPFQTSGYPALGTADPQPAS
jgi:N-acyl homoserine lactone hydrolase